MKYDPIELAKLNINEAQIQRQRDFLLEALTKPYSEDIKECCFYIDRFWLPFVIDMLDDYDFCISGIKSRSFVIINLNS